MRLDRSEIEKAQSDMYIDELTQYNVDVEKERFERIMRRIEVAKECMICGISRNHEVCQIPQSVEGIDTIIFPYYSKGKYGVVAYVNKIRIKKKERRECVVHIKYGEGNYPSYMREVNKQLMKVLKLKKEPVIHCIHINEYVEIIKRNGYYIVYLIECFMKKRDDDRKGVEPKKLEEYVRLESMIEKFRKYKEM